MFGKNSQLHSAFWAGRPGEIKQRRVEQPSVDTDRVVAAVDVARVELPGDEAAVNPGSAATGGL